MDMAPSQSLAELETTLAVLAAKGTARAVAAKINGIRQEKRLFGGFCGRDSGIGPAQRAKTTIWN